MSITYGWDYINGMIKDLQELIEDSGIEFDKIVGIKNGGLYVSQPIAKNLSVPHYTVHISFYRKIPIVKSEDFVFKQKEKVLVLDDLIDGGKTIRTFKQLFCSDAKVGVLFWNKESSVEPDFYVEEKPEGWINFVWESEEERQINESFA